MIFNMISLSSCTSYQSTQVVTAYKINENNIKYKNFTFGNVIQDGKQAVFLNFVSDYVVTKIKVTGSFLDNKGESLYNFDETISFGTPSTNPEVHIRVDKGLIKYITSVSFNEVSAYTNENVNLESNEYIENWNNS